ncbi:hypothetical protein ACH49A_11195 [Micromonospora sediminicola]|uniref:hypothetical protein n=1 Tax=Micromonospora sediminicola TaxID=946078 RepID=UPI00340BAA8A
MTDPFEHVLRTTLTEIAEEAPTVQDSLTRAERRVRHRRRNTVMVGTAGLLAALVIAAPFAYADRGDDGPPSRPATIVPKPSPSGPDEPVPGPPGEPVPSPGGARGTVPPPPGAPGTPVPSPSGTARPVPPSAGAPAPGRPGMPAPDPGAPGAAVASPVPR